jgi:hypothetical protein
MPCSPLFIGFLRRGGRCAAHDYQHIGIMYPFATLGYATMSQRPLVAFIHGTWSSFKIWDWMQGQLQDLFPNDFCLDL